MRADLSCFLCCEKKALSLLEQYQVPSGKRLLLMKKIYGGFSRAEEEISAPVLMAKMMKILEEQIKMSDAYREPKRKYNQLLMGRMEQIEKRIWSSSDPFLAGLLYALTGNYIDFGAMDTVSEEKLTELLDKCGEFSVDSGTVEHLRRDLEQAGNLVYITDNAGEIVLDRLWLRTISKLYPNLRICVLVRGEPILNDATVDDARDIGLDREFDVIPNGTQIPGTSLEHISREARALLDQADVCIAKGQGNFESLHGSRRNIYYLFLCKCDFFVRKFQVEQFTPVVAHEMDFV